MTDKQQDFLTELKVLLKKYNIDQVKTRELIPIVFSSNGLKFSFVLYEDGTFKIIERDFRPKI